jgi:hypothetical protein
VLRLHLEPLPPVVASNSASIIRRSQNEHSRQKTVVQGRIQRFLSSEAAAAQGKKISKKRVPGAW